VSANSWLDNIYALSKRKVTNARTHCYSKSQQTRVRQASTNTCLRSTAMPLPGEVREPMQMIGCSRDLNPGI